MYTFVYLVAHLFKWASLNEFAKISYGHLMRLLDETKRGIIPTLDYFSEIVDNFYFVNAPLFLLFFWDPNAVTRLHFSGEG